MNRLLLLIAILLITGCAEHHHSPQIIACDADNCGKAPSGR